MSAFSPQDALVATMIVTAAADARIPEQESRAFEAFIRRLPVFEGFDVSRVGEIDATVLSMLQEEDGLDQTLDLVAGALPGHLRETAYALACDIAAADGAVALEEMRLLELLRYRLDIDRLSAAAIERGARARHAKL